MRSINQIAQDDSDTSANEAARIRANESLVAQAWRRIAYEENEAACTAARVAEMAKLPESYVRFVCGKNGMPLIC